MRVLVAVVALGALGWLTACVDAVKIASVRPPAGALTGSTPILIVGSGFTQGGVQVSV